MQKLTSIQDLATMQDLTAMIQILQANGWTLAQIAAVFIAASPTHTLTTEAKAAFGLAS